MKKLLIDVNLDECAAAGTCRYMRGGGRSRKGGVRNNARFLLSGRKLLYEILHLMQLPGCVAGRHSGVCYAHGL